MYKTNENPPLMRWDIFQKYSHLINTAVTTKHGGLSKYPYSSLNLALHCGDEREIVIENRKLLCESQDIDFNYYTTAEQTHSDHIKVIEQSKRGSGRKFFEQSIVNTDALIVREKDIMININSADCVPIVLFDYIKSCAAVVHGGWKGTWQLITNKTIKYMIDELQCCPESIIMGIGPAIDSCCFEIGESTANKISESFPYSDNVVKKSNESFMGNLKQANVEQALSLGIKKENIEVSTICTKCSTHDFFSYRAESGTTGRFSTFLILK